MPSARTDTGAMDVIHITADHIDEHPSQPLEVLLADPGGLVWVDMTGPSDADIAVLRDVFHFHPLAIEDATKHDQRPKVEPHEGYLFLTFHAVRPAQTATADAPPVFDEIDMFVGSRYAVTVHAEGVSAVDEARRRLAVAPRDLRAHSDFVLYTVADTCVDSYFPLIDALDDELDGLEDTLFESPDRHTLARLFALKRSLLLLRRYATPTRDNFNTLMRRDLPFVQPHTRDYFLDVYDHLLRITDLVDTHRDILSGAMDIYLSAVNNRLNENVSRLTVITAGLALAAFVTGLYGMNFARLYPDIGWAYGFWFALGLIALLVVAMVWAFRRLKWV